jgi:hypothetical protein
MNCCNEAAPADSGAPAQQSPPTERKASSRGAAAAARGAGAAKLPLATLSNDWQALRIMHSPLRAAATKLPRRSPKPLPSASPKPTLHPTFTPLQDGLAQLKLLHSAAATAPPAAESLPASQLAAGPSTLEAIEEASSVSVDAVPDHGAAVWAAAKPHSGAEARVGADTARQQDTSSPPRGAINKPQQPAEPRAASAPCSFQLIDSSSSSSSNRGSNSSARRAQHAKLSQLLLDDASDSTAAVQLPGACNLGSSDESELPFVSLRKVEAAAGEYSSAAVRYTRAGTDESGTSSPWIPASAADTPTETSAVSSERSSMHDEPVHGQQSRPPSLGEASSSCCSQVFQCAGGQAAEVLTQRNLMSELQATAQHEGSSPGQQQGPSASTKAACKAWLVRDPAHAARGVQHSAGSQAAVAREGSCTSTRLTSDFVGAHYSGADTAAAGSPGGLVNDDDEAESPYIINPLFSTTAAESILSAGR